MSVYGNTALDRKHYVATAYLRYRLINSPRCKAAQVESMARLMRRTVCLPFTTDQSVASRIARRFA